MPSTVEQLVNRMVLTWERRQRSEEETEAQEEPRQSPVITISRDHATGQGRQLAQMVASRLGFEVVGRDLVEAIAAEARVRQQVVESLDEHVRSKIQEYITGEFESGGMTGSEYLSHLSRIVLTLGQHGRVIIVGRGAQFILDPHRTLRVRLTAPLEERIRQVARKRQITERDARAEILFEDSQRAAFCHQHFNRDIARPEEYDLILNYSTLHLELCAEIVERAFRSRFNL